MYRWLCTRSIDMTGGGASASNYGYAGGSMDILSGVTGAFSKLHGEISVNVVGTGGWQTATPRTPPNQTKILSYSSSGFLGKGAHAGMPNDLNGDGDPDWGDTAMTTNVLQPAAGVHPSQGQWVFASEAGNFTSGGRAYIKIADIYFIADSGSNSPDGSGTAIHAWSFGIPGETHTTYYTRDWSGVFYPPTGTGLISNINYGTGTLSNPDPTDSSQIADTSSVLDPSMDVTITVGQEPAIPEPGTLALLGVGGLVLLPVVWRRCWRLAARKSR